MIAGKGAGAGAKNCRSLVQVPTLENSERYFEGMLRACGLCPLYPPKADIGTQSRNVRFVPKADIPSYSITSSARPRSDNGMSIPNALAVLRLMINSTFVDCATGNCAGFSPLRILPV